MCFRNAKATKKQIDLENGIKGPGGCLCMGENCYLAAFLEMSHLRSEDILLFDLTDAVSNIFAIDMPHRCNTVKRSLLGLDDASR